MSGIRGMKFGSRNFKSFDKRSIESKLKEKKETNEGSIISSMSQYLHFGQYLWKSTSRYSLVGIIFPPFY